MPIYTVKSPLNHDGKEYAPGEGVELSEAQAAPLLPDVVEPMEADTPRAAKKEAAKPEAQPEADAEDLSYRELQEEAKRRDLPANGTKEELIARIEADDKKKAKAEEKARKEAADAEDPGANL